MRSARYGFYFSFALLIASSRPAAAGNISGFAQTNLVSSVNGVAPLTDPDLENPWGISFNPTSPFWVSDQVTGKSTLYNGAGVKQGLIVSMPPGQLPTGTVFNTANGAGAFNSDLFLFASLNGSILGWRATLGTTAETIFINTGTTYTGLTSGTVSGTPLLYAADNQGGKIDVYNSSGKTNIVGAFVDPNIPSGFAPYNVQNINNFIYVTYASETTSGGFVSVFNLNGTFVKRLASGGPLDSPWGITLAPAGFGAFGGALLIGNEDNGQINGFDLNGNLIGTLSDQSSTPITNSGLWGLSFGNNGTAFSPNSLYLVAGIDDETQGLFARIDAVPEPGTFSLLVLAALVAALVRIAPGFRRG